MEQFLELRLEPLWESSSEQYTSSFSSSTGAILLGRGGCEPPQPKWKLDFSLASRRHCWFQHAETSQEIVVVDVSRGGTFINGSAVSRSKGTTLADGDILSLLTPVGHETAINSTIRAWKAHIKPSQLTPAVTSTAPVAPDTVVPTAPAQPAQPPQPAPARPLVSFQVARPKMASVGGTSGYAAAQEARDFLERIGRTVEEVEEVPGGSRSAVEPEPEEGPRHGGLSEKATGGEEPEEEAHSDQQVIETAQWLSQLQLTEPQPLATEAKVEGPKEQYSSQYAIIDTNQMLDHLDAVNSLLEHVVGVNVIVPIVVLHELDTISRRGAGAVAAVDATKAAAARCARSFLQRFLTGQRCSSGRERSSISLQEMMESCQLKLVEFGQTMMTRS